MLDAAQENIFARYKHPQFAGELPEATHHLTGDNPSCGDEVAISLEIKDGVFTTIRHQSRACAICTASTDMLAEELVGKSLQEFKKITVESLVNKLGVPLSPNRRKCAILPLEILQRAKLD